MPETEIKIIRSKNRKKTISAELVNGILNIRAPHKISDQKLLPIIEDLKKRINKKGKKDLTLSEEAEKINQEYFSGKLKINSIEYSEKQNKRWGSCQNATKRILISSKLKNLPDWVRAYVIFHEMAHLLIPNHGTEFKKIIKKYPLAERAKGFLMAINFYKN